MTNRWRSPGEFRAMWMRRMRGLLRWRCRLKARGFVREASAGESRIHEAPGLHRQVLLDGRAVAGQPQDMCLGRSCRGQVLMGDDSQQKHEQQGKSSYGHSWHCSVPLKKDSRIQVRHSISTHYLHSPVTRGRILEQYLRIRRRVVLQYDLRDEAGRYFGQPGPVEHQRTVSPDLRLFVCIVDD